jgi:hypothetical protein
MSIWWVASIGSLAGAGFMIRNVGLSGGNISILVMPLPSPT